MKKIVSLIEFKKIITKNPSRIILYGAGLHGEMITRALKKYGFRVSAFVDQCEAVILKKSSEYDFITLNELMENDYVIVTPEDVNSQREIEALLRKYHINDFYYFDCNWKCYESLIACFGEEKKYNTIEEFEQEYKKFRQIQNDICVYMMWSTRVGELIYRFMVMKEAFRKDANFYSIIIPKVELNADATLANQRLMDIFGRYLNIVNKDNSEFWKNVFLWHGSEINTANSYYYDSYQEKKISIWNSNYESKIELTKEELEEAERKCEKLGIKGEFVCIHARDPYYLEHQYNYPTGFFNYHNYRDFSIHNFNKLANYLETKHTSVIRVGKGGKEKYFHRNVVDFAVDTYDELLDLYLNSKCKYYIGTLTGAANIPRLFCTKMITVNVADLVTSSFTIPFEKDEIFISKLYFSKSKNRYLSIKEMLYLALKKYSIPRDDRPKSKMIQDIVYIENTEEDILNTFIEADQRFRGIWIEDEEGTQLQNAYLKVIEEFCQENPFFTYYKRDIRECIMPILMSTTFLKQHLFLIEEKLK